MNNHHGALEGHRVKVKFKWGVAHDKVIDVPAPPPEKYSWPHPHPRHFKLKPENRKLRYDEYVLKKIPKGDLYYQYLRTANM